MAKKISDLYADLQRYVDRFEKAFDDKLASAVGFTVRQRMLQFIAAGISPILGKARYEEYLAVSRNRGRKDERKRLSGQLKVNANQTRWARKNQVGKSRLRALREERKIFRTLKNKATSATKDGYPYNTKQYRAGTKKVRPVNLWLTGDFLQALTFAFVKVGNKQRMSIGWIGDKKNALKEKGHREGANGQRKRPTLPVGNEKFNQTIQLDIMKLLRDAVRKVAKGNKRG